MNSALKKAVAFWLALTMFMVMACAVNFPDITSHWSKSYVEDMAERGVFLGYEDGTFRPENKVTNLEILIMLSRLPGFDPDVQDMVYAEYRSYLDTHLGSDYSWAREELALCLESGIITKAEFESYAKNKRLASNATRSEVAVFLVRGLGLTEEALDAGNVTLPFADADKISSAIKPYVYVLNRRQIVQGDNNNRFNPANAISRAETATMLSRAANYMEENDTVLTLDAYQDNAFAAGEIEDVDVVASEIVLSLESDISGSHNISVPVSAKVYLDGELSVYTKLKAGQYAQVRCDEDDEYISICAFSESDMLEGTVVELGRHYMTVRDSDTGKTAQIRLNELTEVATGTKTGNNAVIDLDEDYTDVICLLNGSRALAVDFAGGTYTELAALLRVEEDSVLLSTFDGVQYQVPVTSAMNVIVNGVPGKLKEAYEGCLVRLRVNEEDYTIESLSVDTAATVVCGTVKAVTLTSDPQVLYITDTNTGNTTGYNIKSGAVIKDEGKNISAAKIEEKDYVVAVQRSKLLTEIYLSSGKAQVEGTIKKLSFGSTIYLTLRRDEAADMIFAIDPEDLPAVKRGDSESSIERLITGDEAVVTFSKGTLTQISAKSQTASVTGTVTKIAMELSGNVLSLKTADGDKTDRIGDNAVIKDEKGVSLTLYDVKVGYQVALVINDEVITGITVKEAAAAAGELSGTLAFINADAQTILVEVIDSTGKRVNMTIELGSGAKILGTDGSTIKLRNLNIGDQVQLYGSYEGVKFIPSLIIVRVD